MDIADANSRSFSLLLCTQRRSPHSRMHHRQADGSLWIYHLSLTGEIGGGLNESHRIDADHAAFSYRVKEPGWEELELKFMLTPGHILAAMTTWGHTGNQ